MDGQGKSEGGDRNAGVRARYYHENQRLGFGLTFAAGAGVPIHMSRSTVGLDRPAATLAADNADVHAGPLGMGEDEIAALKAQKVV